MEGNEMRSRAQSHLKDDLPSLFFRSVPRRPILYRHQFGRDSHQRSLQEIKKKTKEVKNGRKDLTGDGQ